MSTPQDEADKPVIPVDAPANTGGTVKDPLCATPDTQCVVCWLRDKVAKDPETHYQGFQTGELQINIVGVRRKDSINDTFDDYFFLFYKLALAEDKDVFEKAIEQDLRDNWKDKAFKKAADRTRLVPCGKDNGLWAVALYNELSTDPGLTDFPEEKFAKADKELEKKIVKKRAEIDAKKADIAKAQTDIDDKTSARDQMADDASAPKKGAKPAAGSKAAATAEITALTKAETKRNGELAKLVGQLADLEKQKAANDKKLADANAEAAKRDPIAIIGDGTEGGLAPGRAMIPCGVYQNMYRYGVHHLSSSDHLGNAHVALTVGYIDNGYRFYSADYIRAPVWAAVANGDPAHKIKPTPFERKAVKVGDTEVQRIVVGEHIPAGSTKGTKFPEGKALLVEKPNADGTVDIEIDNNGSTLPIAKGDVLALRASIGGTNLHRGHNAILSGGEVSKGSPGGDNVKTFSEGCQVNKSFDHFNQFVRTCAISKRFHCANAKKNFGDPDCARLVASDGEELGHGEQTLVDTVGERTINEAALKDVKKKLGEAKAEIARLTSKKTIWTPEKAAALDTLKADPAPDAKALKTLKEAEFTPQDQVSLDAASASAADLDAALSQLSAQQGVDKQKADLDAEIKKQDDASHKAQKHIDSVTAANKASKHPKTDDDLKTSLAKDYDNKEKADAAKQTATDKKADLDKNAAMKKEALSKRRDFIRERTKFFAGDFLRECDLKWKCKELFTYTLIEFDDSTCKELEDRFAADKNPKWDGTLVLKGAQN